MTAKLALGTVQFGLDYGVAGSGRPDDATVSAILRTARAAGIDLLDTAELYGQAETVLGQQGVADFAIVGKLGEVEGDGADIADRLRASLARIRVGGFYGLLLHRPGVLDGPQGDAIWTALDTARAAGLTGRIGVSTYTPEETLELVRRWPIDIVQLPLPPIDGRWQTGVLAELKDRGVEIHVRSILLQGLLAMAPDARPAYFAAHSGVLSAWDRWLAETGLTAPRACIALARAVPELDRIVVGVDTPAQLAELADPAPDVPPLPAAARSEDPALLNPALWRLS